MLDAAVVPLMYEHSSTRRVFVTPSATAALFSACDRHREHSRTAAVDMDILGTLVGGQACAADGTTAARNPISQLVDTLMEGSAGGRQPKGRTRRAFNPQQGGAQGGAMMRAPPGASAAHARAHAHAQGMPREAQEGLAMGPPIGAGMAPARWVGPRGNETHPYHLQV